MINDFALAEGDASAAEINEGMTLGCNHPMGPLALADLIGHDVRLAIMQTIHDEFGDPEYRPCPLLREMVAAGYLGRKTQRGINRY
jgi:3-hydroxybutyryl-CoA dehydrogenase